jgi:hypothetical protein
VDGNVVRELVVNGSTNRAAHWLPAGKPASSDTLIIPAGKTGNVNRHLEARNIIVESGGTLTGLDDIDLWGSLTLDGRSSWTGTLTSWGYNHLTTGGNRLVNVQQPEGIIVLVDPLHVGSFDWHGSLITENEALTVDGLLYRLEGSYTRYGASTVTSGEYRAYPLKVTRESKDTVVEATQADLVVNGRRSAFEGAGGRYGSLLLEAGETMNTLLSYMIEGGWEDNTPVLTIERGSTLTIEGNQIAAEVLFGPAAQVVRSSQAGRSYTLALPYALEASTTATVSDMHVTGAPLTLHGATDGGGNEGVIFSP